MGSNATLSTISSLIKSMKARDVQNYLTLFYIRLNIILSSVTAEKQTEK